MLAPTILLAMYQFDYEKNTQLLALGAELTPQQWDEPQPAGQRSLHETFFHIVTVCEEYLSLCQTGQPNWAMRSLDDYPDAASLLALNDQLYAAYLPYVEQLTDQQLSTHVTAVMSHGVTQSVRVWQLLLHMLYHSAQHRSEAASILTRYDHSPGFIDFFGFGDWGQSDG